MSLFLFCRQLIVAAFYHYYFFGCRMIVDSLVTVALLVTAS